MSWQRILELARRRGFPVIVTDIAGREPMVVMPFSEYERLGEAVPGSSTTTERGTSIKVVPVMDEPRSVVSEKSLDRLQVEEKMAAAAQDAFQRQVDATVRSLAEVAQTDVAAEGSSVSMEERFYLEPVDEEGN